MSKDIVELTLTGMAYPGKAFGRDESGRMVFVHFGLTDERVLVQIEKSHKRWAEGRLHEILEASPDRIAPKCSHFQECGGCHYQHIPYTNQLHFKTEIVSSQLERIGGIPNAPVAASIPSTLQWNYRNNLQFSLTPSNRLGFHKIQSDHVIPIEECHLPDIDLSDLWPRIELAENPDLNRIAIRSGSLGERLVIFHSGGEPDLELEVDLPASIVWLSDEGMLVLAGESDLSMQVLDRHFQVSAASFFQVNPALTGTLIQKAIEFLEPQPQDMILDLYAGVGLFSAFIAESGARLTAVEQSPWAAEDFATNLDEFDSVEIYEAPVEIALPQLDVRPQKIILDPPRTGLGKQVIKQLVDLSPERVVYISCDPATMARDAKQLLGSGYILQKVLPIDLFPQTYHIETISLFKKTAT